MDAKEPSEMEGGEAPDAKESAKMEGIKTGAEDGQDGD